MSKEMSGAPTLSELLDRQEELDRQRRSERCPDGDCGLYVVARIAGVGIEEARKALGPQVEDDGYTIPQLSAFLSRYGMMLGLGIDWANSPTITSPRSIKVEIDLGDIDTFVLTVDSGSHAILYRDGVTYDPSTRRPKRLSEYKIHNIWPVVKDVSNGIKS